MADTNKTEGKAAVEPEAPSYPVERLIAESDDFFGEPSHVVAGALAGESKKNFTRDEVEAAVKSWLRTEVKTEA